MNTACAACLSRHADVRNGTHQVAEFAVRIPAGTILSAASVAVIVADAETLASRPLGKTGKLKKALASKKKPAFTLAGTYERTRY